MLSYDEFGFVAKFATHIHVYIFLSSIFIKGKYIETPSYSTYLLSHSTTHNRFEIRAYAQLQRLFTFDILPVSERVPVLHNTR